MRHFADLAAFAAAAGEELGTSGWITVTQERIDRFAEATGDFQWIHVDRERAARSPLGTTIAHGFLTLSLLPAMAQEVYAVEGVGARLNYGCNRVRFTETVPCGARLRARISLKSVEPSAQGALKAVISAVIEIEGKPKPACIVEQVALFLPG